MKVCNVPGCAELFTGPGSKAAQACLNNYPRGGGDHMAWDNNRPTHVPTPLRNACLERDGNQCTATQATTAPAGLVISGAGRVACVEGAAQSAGPHRCRYPTNFLPPRPSGRAGTRGHSRACGSQAAG